MVQLKDRQQQETKGKLLISPMPDVGTGSGSFPEPNARSHHWKFATWKFMCKGLTLPIRETPNGMTARCRKNGTYSFHQFYKDNSVFHSHQLTIIGEGDRARERQQTRPDGSRSYLRWCEGELAVTMNLTNAIHLSSINYWWERKVGAWQLQIWR